MYVLHSLLAIISTRRRTILWLKSDPRKYALTIISNEFIISSLFMAGKPPRDVADIITYSHVSIMT